MKNLAELPQYFNVSGYDNIVIYDIDKDTANVDDIYILSKENDTPISNNDYIAFIKQMEIDEIELEDTDIALNCPEYEGKSLLIEAIFKLS